MKVSYKWLQSYFDKDLPSSRELAELLTFHAFEIEGVEKVKEDTVIDIDVLPNRSSDCLSHRGIAHELSVLLSVSMKKDLLREKQKGSSKSKTLSVNIADPKLCRRYSAALLKDVKVGISPQWLKNFLETIGQKSINNIVDATNYVMFDLGQPLHAFDAGKLKEKSGIKITIRNGNKGEKITTLGEIKYETGEETLLIVDGISDTAIGIAGVKGGEIAEVTEATTDIIIESANFDPTSVRKTSKRLKLRTDASVRFENDVPEELAVVALDRVVALILEIAGGECEGIVDEYPKANEPVHVSVTASDINDLLGVSISQKEIANIFDRFGFQYTTRRENFTVEIPFERRDLRITEDLIEEVGRVYGYRNIKEKPLPEFQGEVLVSKSYYYSEKIRRILVELGFSEVYTYSLKDKGDVAMLNPLASDKAYLRADLSSGVRESLSLNVRNAPLLGLDIIKIFEIGPVFKKEEEFLSLALGVAFAQKIKNEGSLVEKNIKDALLKLSEKLEVSITGDIKDAVVEIDLGTLIDPLPLPKVYEKSRIFSSESYKPISQYPFALRDVAVWTPSGVTSKEVINVVSDEVGDMLIRHSLFDTFEKNGKISYAFHLVFQSDEKTLSEEELTTVMDKVYTSLKKKNNWEVR